MTLKEEAELRAAFELFINLPLVKRHKLTLTIVRSKTTKKRKKKT